MRNVSVPLPEPVADKLIELAARELRGTREQAAVLLIDAIRREARRAGRRTQPAPVPDR